MNYELCSMNGMREGMFMWWILILAAFAAVFFYFSRGKLNNREKSALDYLKVRYAKGEISKDELEVKKRDIL